MRVGRSVKSWFEAVGSLAGFFAGFAIILAGLASPSVQAGTTQTFTLAAANHPQSRERTYKVYLPTGLVAPAAHGHGASRLRADERRRAQ